jgi:hypothetical protein
MAAEPRKPKPKPDDSAQYKRFLEAAREAEADQTSEGADRAFKKVTSSSNTVAKTRHSNRSQDES